MRTVIILILAMGNMILGQDLKLLLADGTVAEPKRYDLELKIESLSAKEIVAVKTEALRNEVSFYVLPQMSSEESNFRQEFELLDVAEGFFIYREIRFRAYLYTAYSQKMKRNYQGIIVLRPFENWTRFKVEAHYVYQYRGDKYLRQLSDINGNVLSELAVFSEPPTKKDYRRLVRIIEFSPKGINKIGSQEIYLSVPQKQRNPWSPAGSPPAKRVYTPPEVSAIKLFVVKNWGKPLKFYAEKLSQYKDAWVVSEKLHPLSNGLEEDQTNYVELFKPLFPKGPGEK